MKWQASYILIRPVPEEETDRGQAKIYQKIEPAVCTFRAMIVSGQTACHCHAKLVFLAYSAFSYIFPKLCLILENRFLVRLSSNFQERLLMPSS